jgi:hypothetical protein
VGILSLLCAARVVVVEAHELDGGFRRARAIGLKVREEGEKLQTMGLRFVILPSMSTGWEVLDVRMWVSIKQVRPRLSSQWQCRTAALSAVEFANRLSTETDISLCIDCSR